MGFRYSINKIIIILLLLGNGLSAHCQQMFTHIPNRDYAKVYEVAEIGNHYYFFTRKSYYDTNNVLKGGTYTYKTDLNGNIVDSLLFTTAQLPGVITMTSDGNHLSFYTTRGSQRNSLGFAAKFSLGRMQYDGNFNFVDSFIVDIPQSAFLAGPIWYSKSIKDRVVFVIEGRDTVLNAPLETQQDKVFILDTAGSFLFDKALIDSVDYKFTDITTTNEGDNFIVRLSGKYRIFDDSLNLTKSTLEPNGYYPGFNGLDKFSSDKFTMGFIKSGGQPILDSFCVNLLDTSFNLIKQTCIPRHTSLAAYPNLNARGFDSRWYDGRNKNSIYIGTNHGPYSLLINNYFTLSNLDSNLNLRWAKVFGGDFPYQIERYTSVSDGGCFIMGIRRLGNSQTDSLEPVVFKINQMGAITGITSFAPSVQSFFTCYPNPSQGLSFIKNTYNKPYELMIFSQEGKLVYHKQDIKDVLFSFDISSFASGTYLYKIRTSDGKSAGGKLLKN